MKTINDLSNEVLEIILYHLPPYRDLENCQLVCSRWAALVRNVRCTRNTFFQKAIEEGTRCWQTWNSKENQILPGLVSLQAPNHTLQGKNRKECISQKAPDISHALMVSYEDKLMVFGGCSYTSFADELHVYKIREGRWIHPKISTPWPPAMFGHSATIHGDRMVIFGGYHKTDRSCSI
ncbi:hypothetical protein DMENIID0001_133680 [Sergentomyia squamirostris]